MKNEPVGTKSENLSVPETERVTKEIEMPFDAPPGTKVIWAKGEHGYPTDVKMCRDLLRHGQVYTVASSRIGRSSTRVILAELPDYAFNSVVFALAPDSLPPSQEPTGEREEFEKFQREVRGHFAESLAHKLSNGDYVLPGFQRDWEIWQAARSSSPSREPQDDELKQIAKLACYALTPGGSEFANDAKACIEYGQQRIKVLQGMLKDEVKRRNASSSREELVICEFDKTPHLVNTHGRVGKGACRDFELVASAPSREWIKTEDRLPEERQRVLIWMYEGKLDGYRIRFGEICLGHWRPEGGNGNFDSQVSHWMPLPESPEEIIARHAAQQEQK